MINWMLIFLSKSEMWCSRRGGWPGWVKLWDLPSWLQLWSFLMTCKKATNGPNGLTVFTCPLKKYPLPLESTFLCFQLSCKFPTRLFSFLTQNSLTSLERYLSGSICVISWSWKRSFSAGKLTSTTPPKQLFLSSSQSPSLVYSLASLAQCLLRFLSPNLRKCYSVSCSRKRKRMTNKYPEFATLNPSSTNQLVQLFLPQTPRHLETIALYLAKINCNPSCFLRGLLFSMRMNDRCLCIYLK